MRSIALAFVPLALFASCREIQPIAGTPEEISGYELRGSVTSVNGIAIEAVDVRVWYTFEAADMPPIDTARVVVTDPTKIVDVSVITPQGAFVRQLYLSYRPVGPVPRLQWDYYDDNGNYAPSGEYVVRYAFDTVVVKLERRIIQGTPSAETDASGAFTLGQDRLPIGKSFDIYSTQNQYLGTYTVLPKIDMEFRTTGLFGAASVTLQLNRLTTAAFTVQ